MSRAFTDADLVQPTVSGTSGFTSTATVTLPTGTTEGSCGICVVKASTTMSSPEIWDKSADVGLAGGMVIFTRADIPAGETSWTFLPLAGSPNWVWQVEEWANVSYAAIVTSAATSGVLAPTTILTGTTGTSDWPYVMCVAAFGLQRGTGGANVFPTISAYSNSFTEVGVYDIGDGTVSGDLRLVVARYYGTLNEAGPFSCTATLTGSSTGFTVYGALAVYRAEAWDTDV